MFPSLVCCSLSHWNEHTLHTKPRRPSCTPPPSRFPCSEDTTATRQSDERDDVGVPSRLPPVADIVWLVIERRERTSAVMARELSPSREIIGGASLDLSGGRMSCVPSSV